MDRYQVVRMIGKGTFGHALLCKPKGTGLNHLYYKQENHCQSNYVVIKQIAIGSMNEREKQEAMNEVRVLSSLNHENIIKYISSFMWEGKLCIVMEYAEGGDLYQKLKSCKGNPFKEEQIWDWFIQLCLSVKHIHDRKILHRDLKTQNIFLTKNNQIKVGDFGIARILKNTLECAKTIVGTPYYLSPELCQERPYNHKSDIWSLGCILYELTCQRHAFEGSSMKSLISKILRGIYAPVSLRYSKDLRSLIDMMLQKDPRKRPSINTILKLPCIQTRIASRPNLFALPTPNPDKHKYFDQKQEKENAPFSNALQVPRKYDGKSKSHVPTHRIPLGQHQFQNIPLQKQQEHKIQEQQKVATKHEYQGHQVNKEMLEQKNARGKAKNPADEPQRAPQMQKNLIVPKKFTVNGATLKLKGVTERDSVMYKMESLRLYLEKELGEKIFRQAYHNFHNIKNIRHPIVSLIQQLMICEDIFHQLNHCK